MNNVFFFVVCVIAVTPLIKKLGEFLNKEGRRNKGILIAKSVVDVAMPIILLILSTMALVGNSFNPFLYFQF